MVQFALGREDQRGNGNLMTREKVLEAVKLIKTGEIVSLGMPYDARMPLAPGRAYALRMPGGPTGGPYGGKSKTIWNDEFIATEIGQIGTQMDALGHLGCMCGMRGDKTNMLFYNGNRLSDMWSPYGLKKLGIENAPPFFTRGVLFDVQGLKGRVLDVGEEIALADLKACLERQGVAEQTITPGDAVFVRTGHGTRWYTETRTFYDGAPGIGLECARWFSSLQVCVVGADNFAVEVVPPVDPEIFHPCHQHLIMENGIHLHEGMTFEGLVEREAWVFAYVFAPLPIVGATGSPGKPDRGAVAARAARAIAKYRCRNSKTSVVVLAVLIVLLCASAAGMVLQGALRERHKSRETADHIRLIISILVTFAAVLLGLLITNVKTSFDTFDGRLRGYVGDVTELDVRLREYGDDAAPIRAKLRTYLAAAIADTWRNEPPPAGVYPKFQHRVPSMEREPLGGIACRRRHRNSQARSGGPRTTAVSPTCKSRLG